MLAEGFFNLGFNRPFIPVLGSNCGPRKPQAASSFNELRILRSRISILSRSMNFEGEFTVPGPPASKDDSTDESSREAFRGIGSSESEVRGCDAVRIFRDNCAESVIVLPIRFDAVLDLCKYAAAVASFLIVSDDTSEKSKTISKKRVLIENKHGETLVGLLHETGRSKDLVILCHGFRSSKESRTLLQIADALDEIGTPLFRFDFSGNGESEGSFQYGNYWREVDDLRAVTQHFSSQGRKINAIIGHSKGGNIVLLYASLYHDIPKVINISGRFALDKGIEERLGADYMERIKLYGFIDARDESGDLLYRVTEESLMDRLSTDMRSACSLINNSCRVLTVHGSEDEIIPVEDATEFANLIPNHKLRILEGANHRYSGHYSELSSCILEFIRA